MLRASESHLFSLKKFLLFRKKSHFFSQKLTKIEKNPIFENSATDEIK